ncbi:MAG TPA: hypothetical protein VH120_00910, partial [Gemmataceae bacterium]|nr:hypothetical protein [Gemmataceae bacterium]
PAAVQVLPQGAQHAAVFPFVEAPAGRREDKDARPGMAKNQQFHVAVESRAVPAVIFAMHLSGEW